MIEDLHGALAQHQLSIYYRPIFDLQSGRLIKAEALLRWDHPKIGLMLPAQFIKLAEDAALVDEFNEIGNWVFAEAALRAREWSLLSGASFQVGINLSARQFADHCNCLRWGAYIKTLGLAAHCVSIDIREDALLKRTIDVNDRIVELHEAGIGLTVDHFGRGRLSMSDLKKLSIDTIKIAPALVRDSTLNAAGRRATKDIITLAHRQGVKVVAEWVEKIEQLDWLQDAGCDYVQGYLLAEPVQAQEFEKLLQHA